MNSALVFDLNEEETKSVQNRSFGREATNTNKVMSGELVRDSFRKYDDDENISGTLR